MFFSWNQLRKPELLHLSIFLISPFLLPPIILFGFLFIIISFFLFLPCFCSFLLIFPFCKVYYVVSSFCPVEIRGENILKLTLNLVERLTLLRTAGLRAIVIECKNGVSISSEGEEKHATDEGTRDGQVSFELDSSEYTCNSEEDDEDEEEEKHERNNAASSSSFGCGKEDAWECVVSKFGQQDELHSFNEVLSFWRRKEEGDIKTGLEVVYHNTNAMVA